MSGSLAMAGAAISIGTAIAFALGGTAATVAGPMGLILGGGLLLSGGIYSVVREIEDIQQYVYLTSMETLINGWRIFTGQGISPEIENQAAANKVVVAARQEYDRLHAEHTQKILMSNSQIDILYTSRGEIELQEHYYRKIVVKDRAGKEHLVRDYITPNENVQTMLPLEMAEFRKRWLLPIEFQAPSVVPSEYAYYTAKLLTNTDDSVIAHDNFSWQVIPTYFTGQCQPVGQFVDQQKKSISVDLTLHPKAHHRVMGDFNGDGWQDIGYFLHSSLYLLLANKKGGYYDSQQINYASEGDPILSHHQVGDINSDGLDDIVLISDQHIDILFAQANGDFIRQPVKVKDQGQLKAPALSCAPPLLADINGDGYVDWVSFIHGDINVNYGSPAGEFNSGISVSLSRLHQYSASEYLYHLAGDLNGDGCDDIVSMTKAGRLHTLLGNHENWFDGEPFKKGSQLSYTALTALLTDFNPAQLQLNDIDNDGCADLVVIQDDGSYALSYGGSDNKLGSVVDDTRKLEKGKVMNYRSNRLAVRGKHCILGIIPGLDGKPALLSLNQDGEVNAHTVGTTPVSETIADFRLGGGNDVVIGHQNQKNSFEIGEGSKTFTGGWYADRFLLMGHSAPSRPSILDGGDSLSLLKDNDDNDTIIAAVKPRVGGGYIIDLDTGIVSYTLDEKKTIAILRHIEHAQGHSETNDILQGNDEKNLLNGVGGKDSLYGEGGNDILILQAGIAHGGEGTDSYRILQNDLADNVMVTLYEAPNRQEVSNILLDHTAEQIISISQKEGFILITLRNDNGTRTILGLSDMYRSLTDMAFTDNPLTDTQAILQHNYLLYTRE
ncbi:FG-GAP-like repeat-containing protein [Candidatus Regiella insecticola]|uniref:FG-GAP-like repeat-containing protein n=1 Tax=Candidatus Regiella insecticola TaxID=138073 RepID=UPI00030221F4|nr:VCBS repeat-containing protein [Candidatus Regiella insecticola]